MSPTATPRVELYVRSLASRTDRQERVIEALRRLENTGDICSFQLTIWGEAVGLSTAAVETDRGREVLDTVAAFREWADREGVSLDCAFENRAVTSQLTGEEHATLRLPKMAMAEYEGDEVLSVTPHERDGAVRTVRDRLTTLEGTADGIEAEPVQS
jgi:hypothetical protein